MKQAKTLAVIGSSGMLGSDLVEYLKAKFKVTGIDRENYNQYKRERFDIVVNANGNSNKIWAKENVLGDFEASTISVYKSLFDFPCKTYIYISSADVYENHTNPKFTSELKVINPDNLSSYGLHKYLSENIVRNFSKSYIILRCPMILGTKLKKGPIYDIVNNSRLYVSPKSSFQMITTREVANIVYNLISKNINREIFNVGGKGMLDLNSVSKFTKKAITFPKDGETVRYEVSVSKLDKKYPLKTSLEYLQDFLKRL